MTNYEIIKKCETIDDLAVILRLLFDCPRDYYDCPGEYITCRECLISYLNKEVINKELVNLILQ